MTDTEHADALRQTDEAASLADAELDEIRRRNDYLRTVPFETHGPAAVHSDGCPPCGMVRSISDVTKLLAKNEQQRAQLAELGNAGVQWAVQAEHCDDAFPARTREVAELLAAQYSRLREPGCRPTPWHVVRRVRTDWERVEPETDRG